MRTTPFLIAAVLLAVVTTGCGRAPATGTSSPVTRDRVINYGQQLQANVVPADRISATPKPVELVVVNGQVYAKGHEPRVEATPAPDAPEAGRGHLHMKLDLSGLSSFTTLVRVSVFKLGDTEATYVHELPYGDFAGPSHSVTATNLEPGVYVVRRESVNKANKVFKLTESEATVEADTSVDAEI